MAIDKIFNNANVDGIADNIFGSVNNSVSEVKQMQQRKAAENVQMVVEAFKKIETNITEKFDNVSNVIEKRVLTIKDGRDGINGKDGRDGKDGRNGKDGLNGKPGLQGPPGKDGIDGTDGVSVTDANIDFDGSLIINLSSGKQINVGEIISPELEKKIISVQHGGSSGSGGDVMGPTSATDNRIARFDGTTGKLIQSSAVTINNSGNVSGVGTLSASGVATLSAGAVIQGLTVGLGGSAVSSNTVVGNLALNSNTTGSSNTAVGQQALSANTSGAYNTAVGWQAGSSGTMTGNFNIAVGASSLASTSSGSDNIAVGYGALSLNAGGSSNVAIGTSALAANTTGTGMVAIGHQALRLADTNSFTVAIGYQALAANTTAQYNVAVGYVAATAVTTGTQNTAIGWGTLVSATTVNDNTAIGFNVLPNATGASNTGVGSLALHDLSSGANNIGIGYDSGSAITTGSNNVVIGGYSGAAAPISLTGSNYIVLSDGAGTVRQTIDSTGKVGFGTTAPNAALEVSGSNNSIWSAATSTISGVTLTVGAVLGGPIAIGDLVYGTGVQPYTRITAGSGSSWTVSVSQTVASATLVGGPSYANTLIRITDTDTAVSTNQPTGGLQFYSSDTSSPTAGVGAYVAAMAETNTPDTALVFGTRDNAGGGVDANERARIESGGRLIVGYSASTQAGQNTNIQSQSTGGQAGVSAFRWSNDAIPPRFQVGKSRSATIGTNTIVQSGDELGGLYFYGDDGTDLVSDAASIIATVDGTPGLNDMPGRLTFNTTADGAATPTERMRIDSAGNVGIGATANASAILDAQSTTKGVRMPNMTTTQKNAIASPAAGLMVFDTTLAKLCVYTGAAWQTITSV